jgi:hypothetical protein
MTTVHYIVHRKADGGLATFGAPHIDVEFYANVVELENALASIVRGIGIEPDVDNILSQWDELEVHLLPDEYHWGIQKLQFMPES